MRLFIAITPPKEIIEHLHSLQRQIPSEMASLSLSKHFHLTLKFIGDTMPENTEKIKRALSTITFKPFTVTLDGIGYFPTQEHIRVVWAGVEPHDNIKELHQQIEQALTSICEPADKFHAHLTLARVKHVKNKTRFLEEMSKLKPEPLPFTINEFKLIESQLAPAGPLYNTLAEYPAKDL